MRLGKRIFFGLILFLFYFAVFSNYSIAEEPKIVVFQMSRENKKVFRENLIRDLVTKFKEGQVFDKINDYMISKATELNKDHPRHTPDYLIEDTFNKTDNLFEKTRFAVKDNPGRFYEPISFEKSVQKLLWLRGVCFLVMGIKEEHQMAFSYFYVPGNEDVKREFLEDMINYSFPEVPDIPENQFWRQQMNEAMSRLGYRIFSVQKYGIGDNAGLNPLNFSHNS